MIEKNTSVALSFELIGIPEVEENSILIFEDEEFDYYPVSAIGRSLFTTLIPKSLFELEDIEIET